MQTLMDCWNGCGSEFVVESPSRGSDQLTAGVPAQCPDCGEKYKFTVDGDGEAGLEAVDDDSLGENISGVDADSSTNY